MEKQNTLSEKYLRNRSQLPQFSEKQSSRRQSKSSHQNQNHATRRCQARASRRHSGLLPRSAWDPLPAVSLLIKFMFFFLKKKKKNKNNKLFFFFFQ